METKSIEPTTESLRLGLVMRGILLVCGCVLASVLAVILPAFYLLTAERVEGPGAPVARASAPPIGALVPPVVMLALLSLIAYDIYDAIRMFGRYRRSQQDDQMFP